MIFLAQGYRNVFSDLPSQEMSILQPEEVESVCPDDGGTDIRIPSKAVGSKRQIKHHQFPKAGSVD
jgi:hypothetical protein